MYRVLDLFCGAGGSSLGARDAGLTIAGGVDAWGLATEAYKANFPEAMVFNRDLFDLDPAEVLEKTGPIDVVLSSPECTNHSCAKGNRPRDERSRETALQTIRFAKTFRPRWLILENVIFMRPWSRYGELKDELEGLGYRLREHVLDAADFGVPQRRKRLFLVCDREGEPPAVIRKTPFSRRTVADIIDRQGTWRAKPLFGRGLAVDTISRARRARRALGRGRDFLIVYYGSDGSGGWQTIEQPLRTVTTIDRFGLVQHDGDMPTLRMLQVPELQRAMGFPVTYQFPSGSRRDRIKLLGNAVCPPVMRKIIASAVGPL